MAERVAAANEAFRFALAVDGEHDLKARHHVGGKVTCGYRDGRKLTAHLAKREVDGDKAWYICTGPIVEEEATN